MAKSDGGDPPDQHLFDESKRRPPTRVQLLEFCKRRGLNERQARWLTDFLKDSGTTLTPHAGSVKRTRRAKTLEALPAPPAPTVLLPPPSVTRAPVELNPALPPTETPPTVPTRTSAVDFKIGKEGLTYRSVTHEVGRQPWATASAVARVLAKPFISKWVIVTLGGVTLGAHPLHEPAPPPPVGAGIETYGIPVKPVEFEHSGIAVARPKFRPKPVTPKPWYDIFQ